MRLLDVDKNGHIKMDPVAHTFGPLRAVWDKNKNKDKSAKELAYIFLMVNKTNEFSFWQEEDEEVRSHEIIKFLFGKTSTWKPDEKVQKALTFYKNETQSFTEKFFEDAMAGINKVREYFREVDWEEKDRSGKHIFDINKLKQLVGSSSGLLENINKLQREIEKEEQESSSLRKAGRKKGMYEDDV